MSQLELLQRQVRAIFRIDDAGRLVGSNDQHPPPRCFLGRTPEGNCWHLRADLDPSLARDLERILRAEPVRTELEPEPDCAAALRKALEAQAPIEAEFRGPAFYFPDSSPESGARPGAGDAVAITESNSDLLAETFPRLRATLDVSVPIFGVVRDGRCVSAGFNATSLDEVTEAGVDTVEAYRGRGFARRVVSAWARAIRDSGRRPLYSTAWTNHASRAVARKLGLVHYGEDFHLR